MNGAPAKRRLHLSSVGHNVRDVAHSEKKEASLPGQADPAPKGAPFSPLVLIQAGSGTTPFFCVHGAGGNVLNFRDIARRLGEDQAVYALQARGVDGAPPLETIEQMAELYLASVRRVQPRGPYLFGGYSGGGVIAYEMAQRLHRSADDVALLALLDTFRAGIRPTPAPLTTHLLQLWKEGFSYLWRRAKHKVSQRLDDLSTELKIRFYMSQDKPLPFALRDLQLTRTFLEAADRYEPERYPGRVVLYRATQVEPAFRHAGAKNGWDDLTPNLEVVDVPGDHDSLVHEPNVVVMTSHLRTSLRAAMAR